MKRSSLKILFYGFAIYLLAGCQSKQEKVEKENLPNYLSEYAELYKTNPRQANLEWFKEAKFGLFMHYGVSSILEEGEWVQLRHDPPNSGSRL